MPGRPPNRRAIPLREIGVRLLARRGTYQQNTDAAPGSIHWASCAPQFSKPQRETEPNFVVTNPGTTFVQVQEAQFVNFNNPCE